MRATYSIIIFCFLAFPALSQNQSELLRLSIQGARSSVSPKSGNYFSMTGNSNFAFTGGLIAHEGRFMIGAIGSTSAVNFTKNYVARINDRYDVEHFFLEYNMPSSTGNIVYLSAALHGGYKLISRPVEVVPYLRLGAELGLYENNDLVIRRKRKNENFSEQVLLTESYKYPISFVPTVGLQINKALSKWLLVSLDVNASRHKFGIRVDETRSGIFEPTSEETLANEGWNYMIYRVELGLSFTLLTLDNPNIPSKH